jgi:hypothetical protein
LGEGAKSKKKSVGNSVKILETGIFLSLCNNEIFVVGVGVFVAFFENILLG